MQVANSWGQTVDKRSFEDRKAFVQENLELVLDSAERPFDGHRYFSPASTDFCAEATHKVVSLVQVASS